MDNTLNIPEFVTKTHIKRIIMTIIKNHIVKQQTESSITAKGEMDNWNYDTYVYKTNVMTIENIIIVK